MNKTRLSAALLLASLFVVTGINLVLAQWSEINSGYAVTTNWHKINVPIGQTVVATAGTTDPDVTHVRFIWKNPSNNTVWDENVTIQGSLKTPDVPPNVPQEVIDWANGNINITYWYAQNAHNPDVAGEWGVRVIFYNATKPRGNSRVNFAIRATSFNVIPDAPLVGTAGLVLAMAFGLGLFKFKKNRQLCRL